MMLLNMVFLNNMLGSRLTSVIMLLFLAVPADDSTNGTTAYTPNDLANNTSARLRSLVDGVLVVSVLAIVEVIAVTIVVNDKEDGRVVANSVVIVHWSVINVEGS